jgi:hypothetical protein
MIRSHRRLSVLAGLVVAGLAVPAFAVPIVTTDNQVGPGGAGSTFTPTYTVSGSDLINNRPPATSAGNFAATEITGGLPVMNDGTYGVITEPGGAADRTHMAFGIAGNTGGAGTSVTWDLDTTAAPLGYNLSKIDVYGGWNDNGRDQQLYTVEYSTVAAPGTFIPITTVNYNPPVAGGLQSATLASITDSTGSLATGVGSVRFNFTGFAPEVENGYTGYAEIDVFGTPVPEPASASVLGVFALMALRRGRRAG